MKFSKPMLLVAKKKSKIISEGSEIETFPHCMTLIVILESSKEK
jgi:hypothetical protein